MLSLEKTTSADLQARIGLLTDQLGNSQDEAAALAGITAPTLLLAGDPACGGVMAADAADELAAVIPDCRGRSHRSACWESPFLGAVGINGVHIAVIGSHVNRAVQINNR